MLPARLVRIRPTHDIARSQAFPSRQWSQNDRQTRGCVLGGAKRNRERAQDKRGKSDLAYRGSSRGYESIVGYSVDRSGILP